MNKLREKMRIQNDLDVSFVVSINCCSLADLEKNKRYIHNYNQLHIT